MHGSAHVGLLGWRLVNHSDHVRDSHSPSAEPLAIQRLVERRSFATLATVSPAGRPYVAGVLYELEDDALHVSTSTAGPRPAT